MKNFTGTFVFSRALFHVFSGFFTGTENFFMGKKNTEFNKSIQLYSRIIGLLFSFSSNKMVSGNEVGGGGYGGSAEFCLFFIYEKVFLLLIRNSVRENKNLCVKKLIFVGVKTYS